MRSDRTAKLTDAASMLGPIALAVVRCDQAGNIVEWDSRAAAIYGYRADEVHEVSNAWRRVLDRLQILRRVHERGRIAGDLMALPVKAGGDIEVLVWAAETENGLLLVTSDDVRHMGVHETIAGAHELVRRVVESTDLCVFRQDFTNTEVTYGSLGGDAIYGYTTQEFARDPDLWRTVIHPDDLGALVWPSPTGPSPLHSEYRIVRKDGAIRWIANTVFPTFNADGQLTVVEGITVDVTERRRLEEQLRLRAHHDLLTGVANRFQFDADMAERLAKAAAGSRTALLFIDFDGFKYVNDSFGHQVGDQMLKAVADVLVEFQAETVSVYRMGGDEFAVVVHPLPDVDEAVVLAEAIVQRFSVPLTVSERMIRMPCSIGVAIYPDDGSDLDTLTSHSDIAMYAAKDAGGGRACRFSPPLIRRYHDRLRAYDRMHRGIAGHEFVLHYQPQFNPETGRMVAAEALVRWNDPERGMVSPGEFIPQAEASGLIWDLGNWVLDEAVRQRRVWQDAGCEPFRMSVNVSIGQVAHLGFYEHVAEVLAKYGVDPNRIELEITESLFMAGNQADISTVLGHLRELGVRLAIDDFGSGFSSFQSLLTIAPNTLKIDRSLIDGLTVGTPMFMVVEEIIRLGHRLNMEVVAEGVERHEELELLQQAGCDLIQGFLFSKPLSSQAFALQMLDDPEAVAKAVRGSGINRLV